MSELSVKAESVLLKGDLAELSTEEKVVYYKKVCESLGLNELTNPFQYIKLNGRLTLYATKAATDQLRRNARVSVSITSSERVGDLYVVTAKAATPDGRIDEDMGYANLKGLQGDALGNAMLKATTKAKRRVTLSICGLGMIDESEVETIKDAQTVNLQDLLKEEPKQLDAADKFQEDVEEAEKEGQDLRYSNLAPASDKDLEELGKLLRKKSLGWGKKAKTLVQLVADKEKPETMGEVARITDLASLGLAAYEEQYGEL